MFGLTDNIRSAWSALIANRLRATLTTLGVVIGIFFVLLMGWVLDGLDRAFTDAFAFFGDDILYVDRFDWSGQTDWTDMRNRQRIDYRQFQELDRRIQSAKYVVPTADRFSTDVRYGDLQLRGTMIFGTSSQYIDLFAGNMDRGRFYSAAEGQAGGNVAVLGFKVAENLFPNSDPVGSEIRIDGYPFTVIGVLPKRGTALIDFIDNMIAIPIKRFFSVFGTPSLTINVQAKPDVSLDDLRSEATGVMRSIRSNAPGEPNDFSINSQEMFSSQIATIRAVVWGVGLFMTGLAFLVGSIGIMNIMFVSVAERTREIGISKAVGATRSTILRQFLVEAILLSIFGAIIGLVLTSGIAWFKQTIVDGLMDGLAILGLADPGTSVNLSFLSSTIPPQQILIALLVAIFVGVLAGIIPAFRASRLDPVEALRAE